LKHIKNIKANKNNTFDAIVVGSGMSGGFAAKELTEMRKKDASLPPLSIIFMNEEADLIPAFFKEAGATYPYKIIEIIPFWNTLGSGKDTPGVKYLWNGNEIKYYWGITDDKFVGEDLKKYLNQSYEELKKTHPKL
jgi:hypothetical protein